MAQNTPILGLPWPELTDVPNAQSAFQNLANAMDTVGIPRFTSSTARSIAVSAPQEGMLSYLTNTNALEIYTGSEWTNASVGGVVAWGQRTTASGTTGATELGVLRIDNIVMRGDRQYRIWTSPLHMDSSVANDEIRCQIRYSTSGAATTASTILPGASVHVRQVDHNFSEDKSISVTYSPGSAVTMSLILCVSRVAGTGNVGISNSTTANTIQVVVEEIGPARTQTGVSL